MKKKSVDFGISSCSVYIFLGEGAGFPGFFFGSFLFVWLLRKWTRRNERSITSIYLR